MTTVLNTTGSAPKAPARSAKPRSITVNGVSIGRDEIARETQNHAAETPVSAFQQAARALVIRELLRQEADRLGVIAVPLSDDEGRRETAEEARIRALVEQSVDVPQADEATCQRYFEQNRAKFRSSPLYAARHILIAAPADDLVARAEARHQGEILLAAVDTAPERFSDLAREYSACPSGKTGGELGQISHGQTVPEFERALARLNPGGQPGLVETRFGFHIIALDQRMDGQELPFEIVKERIATYLEDSARHSAMRHYVETLIANARIEGIELAPVSANA